MKYSFSKIILASLIVNVLSLYFYRPENVIDYLTSKKEDEKNITSILTYIKKTFEDTYTYNEISKSPPQPSFNSNYHQKIDIVKRLGEISPKNLSMYELYQQLMTVIGDLKDLHVRLNFEHVLPIIKYLNFIRPISFFIRTINGEPKMFGKLNMYGIYFMEYFKNGEAAASIIFDNADQPIVKINGMGPFEFISNFCGNIEATKNPHGTFSNKFIYNNGLPLSIYPMKLKDLTNLTVVYQNGKILHTEYIIGSKYEFPEILNPSAKKNEKSFNEKSKFYLEKELFKEEKEKYYFEDENEKIFEKYEEFSKNINTELYLNKNSEYIDKKRKLRIDPIEWHFIYADNDKALLKCRIDEKEKLNVYYIHSLTPENQDKYIEEFTKCTALFDTNDYPLVIIESQNSGGYAFLPKFMLEIISPLITTSIYRSLRFSNSIMRNEESQKYLYDHWYHNKIDFIEYIKTTKVFHRNNIFSYLTKPQVYFCLSREYVNRIKPNLIHKRKPTEILIFTDGYSFSAAGTINKYLQYQGGAIFAGYLGDPSKNDIPFDSSQSPSTSFDHKALYNISPDGYRKLYDEFNIAFKSMSGIQSFFDEFNLELPLEYDVTPVDERINFYEHYSDSNYEVFMKEAKNIFEKYQFECNPENKKLVLVNEKCDGKFENEYTHGGFECGDSGFWVSKCVPSYCDSGYVFDHYRKKCIVDKCAIKALDERTKLSKFFSVIPVIIILIITSLIYCSLVSSKRKGEKNKELIEMEDIE